MIIILIFVGACRDQTSSTFSEDRNQNLSGEIIVWDDVPFGISPTEREQYLQRMNLILGDFLELYPNVRILVDFFEKGQTVKQFALNVQRGTGADLLSVKGNLGLINLIRDGALKSLDNYNIDEAIFLPKTLLQARYHNKLYGIPISISTQVLCYNKQKVEEPAKTLSDLVDQARKGYSVGIISGFLETFWGSGIFVKTNLNQSFNQDEDIDTLAQSQQDLLKIIREEGWAQWMEWLRGARNEPNFIIDSDKTALNDAFIEGRLAYLTCSSEEISYLRDKLGKDKLSITLLPHETHQATPLMRTGLLLFNRASSQQQLEIALKLAEFLTNTEQQTKLSSEHISIPTNRDVTPNPILHPLRAILMKQLESSLSFSLDGIEKLDAIANTGEILYRKVLAGELSSDEAANELQSFIKTLP